MTMTMITIITCYCCYFMYELCGTFFVLGQIPIKYFGRLVTSISHSKWDTNVPCKKYRSRKILHCRTHIPMAQEIGAELFMLFECVFVRQIQIQMPITVERKTLSHTHSHARTHKYPTEHISPNEDACLLPYLLCSRRCWQLLNIIQSDK